MMRRNRTRLAPLAWVACLGLAQGCHSARRAEDETERTTPSGQVDDDLSGVAPGDGQVSQGVPDPGHSAPPDAGEGPNGQTTAPGPLDAGELPTMDSGIGPTPDAAAPDEPDAGSIAPPEPDASPPATPRCGDGIVQPPELCDDGNENLADSCPDGDGGTCQPARCGDGIVGDDEECEPTDTESSQCAYGLEGCRFCEADTCSWQPGQPHYCGDGTVDSEEGEECDDGNGAPGDGCGADCQPDCVTGSICRDATGPCDAPEVCDAEGRCPADALLPAGAEGTCPVCQDCNAAGQCEPVGMALPDEGCTTAETCRLAHCDGEGSCITPLAPALSPCGEDLSSSCQARSACTDTGECLDSPPTPPDACGACDAGALTVPVDHATIQQAVNAAGPGACILVLAGTYEEDVLINRKTLFLVGLQGPEFTTLQGSGNTSTLRLRDSAGNVQGFTISGGGGHEGEGGGIHAQSVVTSFRHLVVRDNTIDAVDRAAQGAGMYLFNTTSLVQDVTVVGNRALSNQYARGGGIKLTWGEVWLRDVRVLDNEAVRTGSSSFAGGIDVYGTATSVHRLDNVVVAGNRASSGAGVFTNQGGEHELTNVTIVGNVGEYAAGMYISSSMSPVLTNVIVAHNEATGAAGGIGARDANFTLRYSNLFGNTPDDFVGMGDPINADGNISVDPEFLWLEGEVESWDLRLQQTSACIDAGDPGLSDPDGSRSDMGAHGGVP